MRGGGRGNVEGGARRAGGSSGNILHRVLRGSLPRDASRHSPISSNQEGRTGPQQGRSKQHQRHPAPARRRPPARRTN